MATNQYTDWLQLPAPLDNRKFFKNPKSAPNHAKLSENFLKIVENHFSHQNS
jgi:hypothetical protein